MFWKARRTNFESLSSHPDIDNRSQSSHKIIGVWKNNCNPVVGINYLIYDMVYNIQNGKTWMYEKFTLTTEGWSNQTKNNY